MSDIKHLGPGVWMHGSELHVDPAPILKHLGIKDTQANREMALNEVKQLFRKESPKSIIVDVFDRDPPDES